MAGPDVGSVSHSTAGFRSAHFDERDSPPRVDEDLVRRECSHRPGTGALGGLWLRLIFESTATDGAGLALFTVAEAPMDGRRTYSRFIEHTRRIFF